MTTVLKSLTEGTSDNLETTLKISLEDRVAAFLTGLLYFLTIELMTLGTRPSVIVIVIGGPLLPQ